MADSFVIDTQPNKALAVPAGRPVRKRPRKRSVKSLIAREQALAALVFSGAMDKEGDGLSGQDAEDESRGVAAAGGSDSEDEEGALAEGDDAEEESSGEEESEGGATQPAMLPAWNDDDDASLSVDVMAGASRLKKLRRHEAERRLAGREYEARLRAQFTATQPSTDWAALPRQRRDRRRAGAGTSDAASAGGSGGARGRAGSDDSDDSDAILEEETQSRLLRGAPSLFSAPSSLPASELSVKRAADLNASAKGSSAVGCVNWHPNAQLALTAGLDKTVRLFRVDGQSNALVQSVHLPRMPVLSAVFGSDGSHVLACGRGRQWASFDLNAGRAVMLPGVMGREEAGFRELLPSPDGSNLGMITESGALLLLSAKTKQLIGTLQASQANVKFGGCQCAAFSPDGGLLFAAGGSNQVCNAPPSPPRWHSCGPLYVLAPPQRMSVRDFLT
jgi:U3 small nucleolar RNA-associated protein 18